MGVNLSDSFSPWVGIRGRAKRAGKTWKKRGRFGLGFLGFVFVFREEKPGGKWRIENQREREMRRETRGGTEISTKKVGFRRARCRWTWSGI